MTEHALTVLIVLPTLAALATWVAGPRARAVGVLGALLAFGAALGVTRAARDEEVPTLRASFAAPQGLLEQALARALARQGLAPEAPLLQRLGAALAPGPLPAGEGERLARALALLPELERRLAGLRALTPVPAEPVAEVEERLAGARAEALALAAALAEVEREVVGLREAAGSPWAERYRLVEHRPWVPGLPAYLFLAVDGLSALMALLVALVTLLAALLAAGAPPRGADAPAGAGARGTLVALLLGEAALLAACCALDALALAAAFALALGPAWYLVASAGGPRAAPAAARLALGGVLAALLLLAALLAAAAASAAPGEDPGPLLNLLALGGRAARAGSLQGELPLLALLLVAAASRLPLAPLHGWLPAALTQAGPAASTFLAGAFAASGALLLLRLGPLLTPQALAAPAVQVALALLALGSLAWGALTALGTDDPRRVVAGAALGYGGVVLLGLAAGTPTGLAGARFEALAGALSLAGAAATAALLVARTGERELLALGGLLRALPQLAGLSALFLLALFGLPGLSGLPGRALALHGASAAGALPALVTPLAAGLLALGAAAALWAWQRAYAGELIRADLRDLPDLRPAEAAALAPLAGASLLLGLLPQVALDLVR